MDEQQIGEEQFFEAQSIVSKFLKDKLGVPEIRLNDLIKVLNKYHLIDWEKLFSGMSPEARSVAKTVLDEYVLK